jgi:hypothetical protein
MSALLAAFLPQLRDKLKRQQLRQTVAAFADTDPAQAGALLETPHLLHATAAAALPAVEDFLQLGTGGASARFYYAADVTGTPDHVAPVVAGIDYRPDGGSLSTDSGGGAAVLSGVWRFLVEPPDNGFYDLSVEADAGATVNLTVDGAPVTMALQDGVWHNQSPVELAAGQLHAVELAAKKVVQTLVLRWESPGMARDTLPTDRLYPAELADRFTATYLRLLKALALADDLHLSVPELGFFGTSTAYQVGGQGWLNALPVASPADPTAATGLLEVVAALMRYRELRSAWKVTDDALVGVLADPATTTERGSRLLTQLTGWDNASLTAVLAHLGLADADLADLDDLTRVSEVFALARTLGVRPETAIRCVTNAPTAEIVGDLQSAVRARYDERAWLSVIQPINDELRRRSRDALVGCVLHRLQANPGTADIDTADKLFEQLLIDVQMDPCMQTSRIKQAISTVQLFISRCLLNLEPRVASSSINASWWTWMKRYRVWEANREVFLFPHKWLEPELRDDKSPFFRDLETELLQSDITDDAAARALGHYLEKLDEVAKLEICGMFVEEHSRGTFADDVVHVIGRTAGAKRRYYYRRLQHSTWSPWERVNVDIEDNPVLPVVWDGRLFLFWLGVGQQAPAGQGGVVNAVAGVDKDLVSLKVSDLKMDGTATVTVTLFWSEYYNGKWQPANTSDVHRPIELGQFGVGQPNRSLLSLSSDFGPNDDLVVHLHHPKGQTYFRLYTTHSLPLREQDEGQWNQMAVGSSPNPLQFPPSRSFSSDYGPFSIDYFEQRFGIATSRFSQEVLRSTLAPYDIVAPRHTLQDLIQAPFFFQDRRYVFFVRPVESTVTVVDFRDFGVFHSPPVFQQPSFPPVKVKPDVGLTISPKPGDLYPPVAYRPGVVELTPLASFLSLDRNVKNPLISGGIISYGGTVIGPGGALDLRAGR